MRKKWKEKILKISYEIFTTPIDVVLFTLMMMGEIGMSGGNYTMRNMMKKLDRLVMEGKDRMVRDAIYRAKNKGWIKEDFQLTEEGKKRMKSFLPEILPLKHWNGNWYLTIFDIPERMRRKRDILRENLKRLGFGQLKESCWISAVNYLKNVEDLIKFYNLDPYVILAQTDKLGKEDSRELANRVWKLNKINRLYEEFIFEWEKAGEGERFWLTIKYLSILKKDPQLPAELLPDQWKKREAYQKIKKYLKDKKSPLQKYFS